VGRAANLAAKLSALPHSQKIYITNAVYVPMDTTVTYHNGASMWSPFTWEFDNSKIYGSSYGWIL